MYIYIDTPKVKITLKKNMYVIGMYLCYLLHPRLMFKKVLTFAKKKIIYIDDFDYMDNGYI